MTTKKKDIILIISICVLVLFILLAILAPVITHFDPNSIHLSEKLQLPNLIHILGTDELGRDIFSRILYGARTTLLLGVLLTLIILFLGAILGFLAAFYKGFIETIVTGICTLFLALPSEMLTLMIIALIGPNFVGLVFTIVLAKLPWYVQMIKADTEQILERDYVAFSHIVRRSRLWILLHHVLPNIANHLIVYATIDMSALIISIASLSFLGLGIQAPTAEWGRMLSDAGESAVSYPWQMIPAGLVIFLVSVTLNYIGDSIRKDRK
ncbi:ABC transporter permease [Streptococcus hyointestinalis]|uniref:ABC transporter permease n=1 Tax=Streptococcus hyointestinalis TaxID=1337 RepID=UPI0035197188